MLGSRLISSLTLVAVVALAACGSDSDDSSSSTTPSTKAAASGGQAAVVGVDNVRLGRIVVSDTGATVYTLTDAAGDPVPCEGSCLEAWPPVLLAAGTKAKGGPGVENVAVITEPEGEQVTIDGLPLYTFAGDSGPGDTNGDGIPSFGGTWHVVKLSASSTATTDTTATTSTYDYDR